MKNHNRLPICSEKMSFFLGGGKSKNSSKMALKVVPFAKILSGESYTLSSGAAKKFGGVHVAHGPHFGHA
jgi:hypothetical protein